MISDNISNKKKYISNKILYDVLTFCESQKDNKPNRISFDEKNFAIIQSYDLSNEENCVVEAHRKYIDLHYVIEGCERFGYKCIDQAKYTSAYDVSEDTQLFLNENLDYIDLKEGDFIIFFPNDIHMSRCKVTSNQHVVKLVAKLAVESANDL